VKKFLLVFLVSVVMMNSAPVNAGVKDIIVGYLVGKGIDYVGTFVYTTFTDDSVACELPYCESFYCVECGTWVMCQREFEFRSVLRNNGIFTYWDIVPEPFSCYLWD
jgi:hypothetical protein